MKRKIFFALISGCLLFVSCSKNQPASTYTVEGSVPDSTFNGKTLYLMDYDNNRFIDSTVVNNKKFIFTGKTDTTRFCRIDIGDEYVNLILENGTMTVNLKNHNAEGTPLNKELSDFRHSQDSMVNQGRTGIDKLNEQEPDPIKRQQLEDNFRKKWIVDFTSILNKIIEKNPNNEMAVIAITEMSMLGNPQEVDVALSKVGALVLSKNEIKRIVKNNKALINTSEGKPFVNFTGENMDGKKVSLSDYVGKGKYILVDFWASWCGPCRAETPNITTLYKKYKGKNFDVVSVAVWDKPEDTLHAIIEDKITWPQILNTGEEPCNLYGIRGIPHIILFGPDGTILARDLRGDKMEAKVKEVMRTFD